MAVAKKAKTTAKKRTVVKKLTLEQRVEALEKTMNEAMAAGEKIHAEIDRWRQANAPKWVSRTIHDGKPNIRHAKVKVFLRCGEMVGPESVDAFSWDDRGDRTIVSYAVV